MKKFLILFITIFVVFSVWNMIAADKLKVLFLSGGGGEPNTGHNGRINHHKLKPSFLRAGIQIAYSSNLDHLDPEILARYDVIIMYLSAGNEKPNRVKALVEYIEKGGGLVALHNTCGAFGPIIVKS